MISTNPADWIGKRVHMTQAGAKALAGMYRKCKGAGVVTRWTRLTAEYVNVRPDNYKKATRFAAEFWEEIEVHPARLSKYEHDRFCGQCGAEQPCATHCRYRAIQAETGIWFLWRCVDRTWETVGQVEVVTLAALGDLADLKR